MGVEDRLHDLASRVLEESRRLREIDTTVPPEDGVFFALDGLRRAALELLGMIEKIVEG